MIKVFFFASVREELGLSELSLDWDRGDVKEVIQRISTQEEGRYKNALSRENLLTSINQEIVSKDHLVEDGDEVGFFPPVTGG